LGLPFDFYYISKKRTFLEKWKKNRERRQFEKKLEKIKEKKGNKTSL